MSYFLGRGSRRQAPAQGPLDRSATCSLLAPAPPSPARATPHPPHVHPDVAWNPRLTPQAPPATPTPRGSHLTPLSSPARGSTYLVVCMFYGPGSVAKPGTSCGKSSVLFNLDSVPSATALSHSSAISGKRVPPAPLTHPRLEIQNQ